MAHDSHHPDIPLRAAIAEVWAIAWPTVMTMTSYTIMQFVDKLMVGQVSPTAVAAQGNGGIWAFTPIAVFMGFLTVVNTFVSQNLGAGTPERGPRYAWGAIWISLVSWATILVPLSFLLPWAFARMHAGAEIENVDELIELETTYGRVLLLGGLLTLIGRSMHHYFFGLHRPKVITVSAVVGNVTNVTVNYLLIFGTSELVLGPVTIPAIPALGLFGAALGTVIGTAVECLIPLCVFLGPKMNAELKTRSAWRPNWKAIVDLLRIGWPAAVQYGNEIICWSIFMVILVGKFGTDHMAAGWIALSYMHLSFMPSVGFSVAVTSLVGKNIGAGTTELGVRRARLGLAMAMIYMTTCAVIFVVFRGPLVGIFISGEVTPEEAAVILDIGMKLMICAAVFQTIDALGIVYTGALRGAGDTIWPGVVTMIFSWLFIVGGGYAMIRFAPQLESIGPWIAAAVYIILYGLAMVWRFESGAWRSINLLDREGHGREGTPGPAAPTSIPDASIRDIVEDTVE